MNGLAIIAFLQISIGCSTLVYSEIVRCVFQFRKFDDILNNTYTCATVGLNYPTKIIVEDIAGKHKGGQGNKDVKALDISNQNCEYFPKGFHKFLPNIEGIAVMNSNLKSIRSTDLEMFSKLKSLSLAGNKLLTLEFGLLAKNHKLRKISFANNQLIGIGRDLIDNLENLVQIDFSNAGCVNKKVTNEQELEALKAEITEKCPATDDMQKLQEIEVKLYFCNEQLENATTIINEGSKNYKECLDDNKKVKERIKQVQTQLDQCSTGVDDKTCKNKLAANEKQAASFGKKIKLLEEHIAKLQGENKELKKINTREVTSMQSCTADLEKCKNTPKPMVLKDECKINANIMSVVIECDKFYDSICISENTLIPFDGMTIGGVKLPNGTIIDGSFVTELQLFGGSIRAIPDNFGQYFINLITFYMSNVKVNEINKFSFTECKHLTNLTIINGKLSKIHEEAFISATNLIHVDFSNNLLNEIGTAIKSLQNLETFILNGNKITTIEWKWFSIMKNIKIISITNNQLEHVDSGFLNPEIFTNLVTVDMSGSKCVDLKYPAASIEDVKKQLYSGCPFKVDLKCDLMEIGKDYVCEAKDVFIIYENTIISSIITTNTITQDSHSKVTKIIVKNQTMNYIPSNFCQIFGGNVAAIEIDNSNLHKINNLIGLKEITIINNNVEHIDATSFAGSPNAEVIILHGNKIQKIKEGTFANNKEIQTFDISNNNIIEITSTTIETILISSNVINLSGNKLTIVVWTYDGPVRGQIIAENNPCLDAKSSNKNSDEFIKVIHEKCSEKIELECEFKMIDGDYVCIAKNLTILIENTKIIRVFGTHTEPGMSSQNVTKLIIQNQNMNYFPNNIAAVFPMLTKIEVISSNLKKISKFIGQNLLWIKINDNKITKIDENSFVECPGLTFIDLSQNGITNIPDGIFGYNSEVTEVNLSHNSLEIIKWSIFNIMTSLQVINVSYNRLKYIHWTQLAIEVENIDLSGNECINLKYSIDEKDQFMETINNVCGFETTLTCNFKKSSSDYICHTVNLEILNENTKIVEVRGTHLPGKSDKDVTRMISQNQNVTYFPINVRKFFTKLRIVDIISKTFKLKIIFISDDKFSITSQ